MSAAMTKPASLTVEFRLLADLVPYANNARTHSLAQIAQIKALMLEYGWTNPVLADDKGIIAGHGRVLAAEALYAEGKAIRLPGGPSLPHGTVPVIDCTGWNDVQRRAYILADNKSALNAGWDEDLLAAELKALGDFDLALAGFTESEFSELCSADDMAPGTSSEQPPLDRRAAVTCPECGHVFHPA